MNILSLDEHDPLVGDDAILRTIRDEPDNAMMESFWSSMQIEMLNRKNGRPGSN
jgi:hypothetical protein